MCSITVPLAEAAVKRSAKSHEMALICFVLVRDFVDHLPCDSKYATIPDRLDLGTETPDCYSSRSAS